MRLLVLDNAIDHDMYRPVEHWCRLAGFVPDSVYASSGAELPAPGDHTHVILTGSESSIVERAPWAEAELRWVQQAAARGVRILGSCWGHQLIAAALGGPECVRRSPTPEFGWQHIELRPGDDAGIVPSSFDSFVSHFDEVVPGCHHELRVLASSPRCAVHALRWGDLPVWGIQAHPEIDPPTGRAFLEIALQRWPEHAPLFRAALDGPARDSQIGHALVERFLAA